MIFVTVGSQKFQFNRLLKQIDKLIENNLIKDDVFAQIGYSDYNPIHYRYKEFITQEEFKEKIKESKFIITHGGTGVIITALKNNKKVIGIPRLKEYQEHVDNHQIQLINEFKDLHFIEPVYEIKDLGKAIKKITQTEYNKYISNTQKLIEDIIKFIEEWDKERLYERTT